MLPDQRGSNRTATCRRAASRRGRNGFGKVAETLDDVRHRFERADQQVPGKIVLGLQPLVIERVDDPGLGLMFRCFRMVSTVSDMRTSVVAKDARALARPRIGI